MSSRAYSWSRQTEKGAWPGPTRRCKEYVVTCKPENSPDTDPSQPGKRSPCAARCEIARNASHGTDWNKHEWLHRHILSTADRLSRGKAHVFEAIAKTGSRKCLFPVSLTDLAMRLIASIPCADESSTRLGARHGDHWSPRRRCPGEGGGELEQPSCQCVKRLKDVYSW